MFADKGWYVGATDVDKEGLERLKKIIGEDHFFSTMNVTDASMVEETLSEFSQNTNGKIEVLFNNAGVAEVDPFEKTVLKQHFQMLDVNIKGVLNCTYSAFPYLKHSDVASVINMSSAAANYGVPSEVTYSGTKFFVRGFTEALNIEWEQYKIHVCDIMPNYVDTPMVANVEGKIIDNIGVKLTAQDVANTVWQAVHTKKIHWPVDRIGYKLLQKLSLITPNRINRFMMKKLAGY